MGQLLGVALLAAVVIGCSTLASDRVWKTYEETVTAGERQHVASHGRWDLEDGACVSEEPPRLVIARQPAHGRVEFQPQRGPSDCDAEVLHMAVYYTSDPRFSGSDRFTYFRVNPATREQRLVAVEVAVRPAPADSD